MSKADTPIVSFVVVQKVWAQTSADFDSVEKTRTLTVSAETKIGEVMRWASTGNFLGRGDVVLVEQDHAAIDAMQSMVDEATRQRDERMRQCWTRDDEIDRLHAKVYAERERCAQICERVRPTRGRALSAEQAACYEALTYAAKEIRAAKEETT
jgi:uncharacterized protein YaaQ